MYRTSTPLHARHRNAELRGQSAHQLLAAEEAPPHQRLAQLGAEAPLIRDRRAKLALVDQTGGHQDLADPLPAHH
jgi:hypothetical protein